MGSCKWLFCKSKFFTIHVYIHSRAGSKVPSQISALQITINLSVNRLLQTSLRRESNTAVKVHDISKRYFKRQYTPFQQPDNLLT